MSFDLIIKNGTVILENESRVVDIAVADGKIAAIGENLGEADHGCRGPDRFAGDGRCAYAHL